MPALADFPASKVSFYVIGMGQAYCGAVNGKQTEAVPRFRIKMIFEKLIQLMIEFDESVIFELHPRFCQCSFTDNPFWYIGFAEDTEKPIQFALAGSSYKAQKKGNQRLYMKFSFSGEIGLFLAVFFDKIIGIYNIFKKNDEFGTYLGKQVLCQQWLILYKVSA